VAVPADGAVSLTWSPPGELDLPTTSSLVSASCPSPKLCVGYDNAGTVASSTDPAAGPSGWSVASIDRAAVLTAMTCPSASLCVGYDSAGNVVSSTKPTGGRSAWKFAKVNALGGLQGLTCPSVRLCVAVDGVGDVITSTNPNGGTAAWKVSYLDDTAPPPNCYDGGGQCENSTENSTLADLSCPSTTFCAAVDQAGQVIASSDPTGGAGAWKIVFAVPTASDEVGVYQLACESTVLCAGTDDSGDLIVSTDPLAGQSAWQATGVNTGGQPNWMNPNASFPEAVADLACPTVSFCLGVGDNSYGDPIVTTDPTDADPIWKPALKQSGVSISCAAIAWCFAWDAHGNLFSSRHPAAGPDAWSEAHPDGSNVPAMLSCPSSSLCLELDNHGNLLVGQPTPSRARIRALLLKALGTSANNDTTIAELKRHGYRFSITAPAAGRLTVSLRTFRSRRDPSSSLVATGHTSFANTKTSAFLLKLTLTGRRLLASVRDAHLTATASLKPAEGPAVTAARPLTLRP
jgi:hypothetical protein